MKYCPVCRKTYGSEQEIRFCEDCGVMLEEEVVENHTPDTPVKKDLSKAVIAVLAAFLAVAVVVIIILVLKPFQKKEDNAVVGEYASDIVSADELAADDAEILTPAEKTTVPVQTTQQQTTVRYETTVMHNENKVYTYEELEYGMLGRVCYSTPDHAGLNLRSETNSTSDLVLLLHEGSIVEILGSYDSSNHGYIRVGYSSGTEYYEGWILARYIEYYGVRN